MSNVARLSLIAISFAITIFINTVDAYSYNIGDALLKAYINNNALLSKKEALDATKLEKPKAYTEFMPNVITATKFSRNIPKVYEMEKKATKNSRKATLQASLDLFTGGSTITKINMSDKKIAGAVADYQDTLDDITYKVISAYQNIIYSKEYYNITMHNVKFKENVLKTATVKFKMGEEVKTEVIKAKAELAAAVAGKEDGANKLQNAIANFVYLVGEVPPELIEPINTTSVKLPDTLEDLTTYALKNNPKLIKSKMDAEYAKKAVNLYLAKFSPQIKLTAQASRSNLKKYIQTQQGGGNVIIGRDPNTGQIQRLPVQPQTVTLPNPNKDDGNSLVLEVDVPIFQKGLEYLEVSEARKKAKSASSAFKYTESEINFNTIQAWNNYHSTKYQLESLKESTIAYKEAVKSETEKYEAGATTITELLRTQNDEREQQIRELKALNEHKLSIFQIKQLMGDISKMNYSNHKEKQPPKDSIKNKKSEKELIALRK